MTAPPPAVTRPDVPVGSPRTRRRPRRGSARTTRVPYYFALPALVFYVLVMIYPTASGAGFAFTDWNGRAADAAFVGLENFGRLFGQVEARAALINTMIIAIAGTALQNLVGLALALVLHRSLRTRNVLRTLFFAPAVLPAVVVGFLWQYLLTPLGPVNEVLRAVGLGALAQNWLGDERVALGSVIGVIIWQNAGMTMVILLAGLQGIGDEVLEAAQLDGASGWRMLRHITLPLLLPALTITLSLTLISGLKVFDQVFVMTGGGPGYATETMSLLMYKTAFVFGEFGYSAAISLVLTMIVVALALLQIGGLRRAEGER